MILQITSVFENSQPTLQYASCGDIHDGNGYSAGFIQFTTRSGSALLVIQNYLARYPNAPIGRFEADLKRVVGSDTLVPGGFCDAWSEAAKDNGFASAQRDIQENEYLAPNARYVAEYGLRSPLSVGQFYDCSVQLGLGDCIEIAKNVWAPSPAKGGNEATWLKAFIDARDSRLDQRGGAYPGTKYRTRSYRWMVDNGFMGLEGNSAVMLENGGGKIMVGC